MKKEKNDDLLHKGIIYKILSSMLYLIAYPILFTLTRIVMDLKIEGRENLKKVGDEYITVANHINMLDCAMIVLSIFPRIPYFLTLQSNLEIPFIKYLVMLFRGLPIPESKSGKEKMVVTVEKLLQNGEIVGIYPEGHLIPYCGNLREFKDGAFNFAVKNQVPIVPILFTYREPKDFRKFLKKKPFITLSILEPEYPNSATNKNSIKELKSRVYNKMNMERRKKQYSEEAENEFKQGEF